MNESISFEDIAASKAKLSSLLTVTPVFTSSTIDDMTGREIYFKAENMQKTGSFKIRGALNKVLCLKENNPGMNGVVTYSCGNHGIGVAYAAKLNGISCTIVMPSNAPQVRIDAIKCYGAKIVFCEPNTCASRDEICKRIGEEMGLVYVPSSDDPDVIAGQGTLGLEFLEQQPELDAVFVCIGGGGMSSGMAIATKAIRPTCKVFLVEPKGKNLEECLHTGDVEKCTPLHRIDTIADSIRCNIGKLPLAILCQHAEKDIFTVTDDEVKTAMKFMWERTKLVIEASAALTVAAVLSEKTKQLDPAIKKIGVVLCGGNVDLNNLPWMPNFKK